MFHYWQIAALGDEEAAALDADLKLNGKIAQNGWVVQARTMLDAAAA